jgi:hypothetical protein
MRTTKLLPPAKSTRSQQKKVTFTPADELQDTSKSVLASKKR